MENNSNSFPQKILVMKFGGTSVGSVSAIRSAIRIVCETKEKRDNVVVVTSAISGATNLLIKSAQDAAAGNLSTSEKAARELMTRHHELIDKVVTDSDKWLQLKMDVNRLITTFTNLCQSIKILGELTPRALDTVSSMGERMSVMILSAGIESAGFDSIPIESSKLIITDNTFQSAVPDTKLTSDCCQKILCPYLNNNVIPVVTGFMGATKDGVITTLGRGGSDYSASILGVALKASDVWIWTDVTGVMSADPRIISEAKTIPFLSYREISEMAFYGAKVLHPKSIQPCIDAGITLRICNTFYPDETGTILVPNNKAVNPGKIKAVTSSNGFKMVSVQSSGLENAMEISSRIFQWLLDEGVNIPLVIESSSEQSLCFPVLAKDVNRVEALLKKILERELNRNDVEKISSSDLVDIITVICPEIRNSPSAITKVLEAIDLKKIKIKALSFGASDVSMNLIVNSSDTELVMKTIHSLIKN